MTGFVAILVVLACPGTTCKAAFGEYNIIAVQHQEFNTYSEIYDGLLMGIKEYGIKEKISVHRYNAQKNYEELNQKLTELNNKDKYDIVVTLGTQSSKRALKRITKIPIIFAGVASPVTSGVVDSWDLSGTNATGIATRNQILKGLSQIYDLWEFNRIGIVYLKESPSHEAVFKQIKAMCKRNGVEFASKGFFLHSGGQALSKKEVRKNIKQSLDFILPKVDVIYIQASGTFTRNFDLFQKACQKHKIPSFGHPIYIEKGIIVGIGINNFASGKQAADYAVKILRGVAPSDLPLDIGNQFIILVNFQAAQLVNFPPELLLPVMNSPDEIYQKIQR